MMTVITFLIYAYFCAGILSSLISYFAQKYFGPSKLFLHGKAAETQRITNALKGNWIGWIERLTVSKHLFWHFYASGFLLSVLYLIFFDKSIAACFLAIQCLRRLFECFLVMPGGKDSQMHLIHYLIGLSYYPVLLVSFVLQSNTNTELIYWIILFVVASGLQFYCHLILGQERSKSQTSKKHRPLNHPIFKLIHTPHYFSELLIYTSMAGLNNFQPLSLMNLFWIITILGVSAKNSADWLIEQWGYKSHGDFCKYLMIPFLF